MRRSGADNNMELIVDNDLISSRVEITHWLPIITRCPLARLPDVIYATVIVEDHFVELFAARKRIRRTLTGKRKFMELLAQDLLEEFPESSEVRISLLFGRHKVTLKKGKDDV